MLRPILAAGLLKSNGTYPPMTWTISLPCKMVNWVRWHIKHGDFFHFANCLTVIACYRHDQRFRTILSWATDQTWQQLPMPHLAREVQGCENLHSFDVGWTTKTTYHILNTKLVSHLLTSWNLQNSPRILFLRLFPTSGCPEMGVYPNLWLLCKENEHKSI